MEKAMSRAIVIRNYGGPEVLQLETVDVGAPAATQVRVRLTCIGVNFHDTYVRSGLYKALSLPGTPGIEAVGVVDAVGADVTGWKVGDRVAYVTPRYGVYATENLIDADMLIAVPAGVSDELVASTLLRGLTVDMLVNRVTQLKAGQTILVQAAGGGVGQLLCQWASRMGVRVIGTAGSDRTAAIARDCGCEHVFNYRTEDVAAKVKEITQGKGAEVVYDAVGKDTFDGSLNALAMCGHLVNYGQASGPIPAFEISRLSPKSGTVSRPVVFHYTADRDARREMAANFLNALEKGWLHVSAPRKFALADAAECHRVLEKDGASTPLLLVP